MSDQNTEPQAEEAAGESSRVAGAIVALVLTAATIVALKVIVTAVPYVAYFVAGVLACLAGQKALRLRHRTSDESPAADAEPTGTPLTDEEVVTALHRLATPHVFLSVLAADLDLSKETTRSVLEELGIEIRRAVRVGGTTGVGVHADDIPPLPQPLSEDPLGPVDQGQPTNQQSVRIERTDGGFVIYDLTDGHRHHTLKEH